MINCRFVSFILRKYIELEIIKKSSEISEIFAHGRRISTPSILFIIVNRCDRASKSSGRVAFIAGKKQGCAVWRNSAKRRLREIYKINKSVFYNYDVLLVAKRNILERDFWKIVDECKKVNKQNH